MELKTRQEANIEIMDVLMQWINAAPDMRFAQILINAGITHENDMIKYYEESTKTLERTLKLASK